ncbi:hypothetical protein K461DRAFT_323330 [Myriangium duriaei CBS 260.36]|uniref:Uncharacterized protein n=1 Tax=Myriangium duriaei CBS 260.36 TaxID=1168546 RepID=A0A9P4IVY4_9PEZI|nr:hypothetical protein K461DRAFT_323330 [Myriangium duriaei CBS 260.36]
MATAFTVFPEVLDSKAVIIPEAGFEDPNTPHPDDQDAVRTVYFVNMAPGTLSGEQEKTLQHLQQNVLDFSAWASTEASRAVQNKIDKNEIPRDDKVTQGSYRAKVMDWILNNRTTWLAKTNDSNSSERIRVKKAEFHTALLLQAIKGFAVPTTALLSLEKIVTSIGDSVKFSATNSKDARQYWIMLTYYTYFKESNLIQPSIRTIGFQVTKEAREYVVGKSKVETVDFQCSFSGSQFDFNNKIYEGVAGSISAQAIEKGKEMLNDKSVVDIPI